MSDFDRLKTMLRHAARDGTAPLGRVGFDKWSSVDITACGVDQDVGLGKLPASGIQGTADLLLIAGINLAPG